MAKKIYNNSQKVWEHGTVSRRYSKDGSESWRTGYFKLKYGIVIIYSQEKDETTNSVTTFDFIYRGYSFYRCITGKDYTDNGLIRLAAKFGRECVSSF